jgi:hypothetical protein
MFVRAKSVPAPRFIQLALLIFLAFGLEGLVCKQAAAGQSSWDELKQQLKKTKEQIKEGVNHGQPNASVPQPSGAAPAGSATPTQLNGATGPTARVDGAWSPADSDAGQSTSPANPTLSNMLDGTTDQPQAAKSKVQDPHRPPAKLPDIVGIRLGMPLKEAIAVLQSAYPKDKLMIDPLRLPMYSQQIINQVSIGFDPLPSPTEEITTSATSPLEHQVIYRVRRMLGRQHIYRDNLIASLREKYGKETVMSDGAGPTDPAHATEMMWLLDGQGHPVALPSSTDALYMVHQCVGTLAGGGPNDSTFAANNITSEASRKAMAEGGWCNSSIVAVVANFTMEPILTNVNVTITDIPAVTRAARAEVAALDDYARHRQQQALDDAKKQKPVL